MPQLLCPAAGPRVTAASWGPCPAAAQALVFCNQNSRPAPFGCAGEIRLRGWPAALTLGAGWSRSCSARSCSTRRPRAHNSQTRRLAFRLAHGTVYPPQTARRSAAPACWTQGSSSQIPMPSFCCTSFRSVCFARIDGPGMSYFKNRFEVPFIASPWEVEQRDYLGQTPLPPHTHIHTPCTWHRPIAFRPIA